MADDLVADEELLNRSVRREWVVLRDEKWKLSSQAFNDVSWKPSVDRATLRSAEASKHSPTDGVCCIQAAEVRSISTIEHQTNKTPYKVDVMARPVPQDNPGGLPENPAHAQVEVAPEFENKSRFNKLKDSLCRLARERGWVIEPS